MAGGSTPRCDAWLGELGLKPKRKLTSEFIVSVDMQNDGTGPFSVTI
jgi:hypothetical protein